MPAIVPAPREQMAQAKQDLGSRNNLGTAHRISKLSGAIFESGFREGAETTVELEASVNAAKASFHLSC